MYILYTVAMVVFGCLVDSRVVQICWEVDVGGNVGWRAFRGKGGGRWVKYAVRSDCFCKWHRSGEVCGYMV